MSPTIRRFLKSLAITITILGTILGVNATAFAGKPDYGRAWFVADVLKVSDRCNYEDGSGQGPCFWNAKKRGNRQGVSFWSIPGGSEDDDHVFLYEDGSVTIVTDRTPEPVRWSGTTDGLPSCSRERDNHDQWICFFDAKRRGDGKGQSYVALNYGGTYIYEDGGIEH